MNKVKFECMGCGCYFWVDGRKGFECPNCKGGVKEMKGDTKELIQMRENIKERETIQRRLEKEYYKGLKEGVKE